MLKNNPIVHAVMDSLFLWDKDEDADSPDFIGVWTQWITERELGFEFTEADRIEALAYLAIPEVAAGMQGVVDNNPLNVVG